MDDDSELLRRYATTRDEAAFAELVGRRLALVYHAALRRVNGDAALAEEVAQSVFVSLARHAETLRHHAVLSGWLYVATRHAAANALRQDRRRQLREQEAHLMHEMISPATEAAWAQLRPELDAVMDELSDAERDVVLLRYFEDQSYAAIGAQLRITEDAARMRADRALDKLRLALGRRGVVSTAAALGGALAAQSALAAPPALAAAVTSTAIAAGTAPASLGLLAFMSTNKIIAVTTGALVLAAGGTAVFEYQAARRAEMAVAATTQDQASLRSQLQRERERTDAANAGKLAAEQKAAELAAQLEGQGKSPSGRSIPAVSRSRGTPARTTFSEKIDVLYANPEYVQLQLKQVAATQRLQYGELYATLRMNPEQIAEFESLMLQRQQAMFDTFAAARSQGVSINDPIMTKLPDSAQGEIEEKLKGLLGKAGYQSYKDYTQGGNGMARSAAGNLASSLYYTSTPLTAEQGRQLVQLVAANTAKPAAGISMQLTPEPDWAAIYPAAAQILNKDQLATLQATNDQLRLGRQLADLSDRLLQEAAASGGP